MNDTDVYLIPHHAIFKKRMRNSFFLTITFYVYQGLAFIGKEKSKEKYMLDISKK